MTKDDIIAAFRNVHTDIGKSMEQVNPLFNVQAAVNTRNTIEVCINYLKEDNAEGFKQYLWGEISPQEPDKFDFILDEVFCKLDIKDIGPIFKALDLHQ